MSKPWTGFIILLAAVWIILARPAFGQSPALGCCTNQAGACIGDLTQFSCDQSYSSGTAGLNWHQNSGSQPSCAQVTTCAITGKCQKGDGTDCSNVQKWQCDTKAGYNFFQGQLCSQPPVDGTCCKENPGAGGTAYSCEANIDKNTCNGQRLGQWFAVACNSVPDCPQATGAQVIPPQSLTLPTPNTTIVFNPEIPIPNFAGGPVSATTAAQYIRAVFIYFIWIVGVLAVVMVTYGGIRWVAAAGNPGRINEARSTINNALIGLIIALTAVVLLNTINPSLTQFHGITPTVVTKEVLNLDSATGENNEAATCKTKEGPVQQESSCFISNQSFVWPVSDANQVVTSRIGPRSVQVGSSCHPGTDFSTNQEAGKNVVAMFDGTITSITSFCNESIIKLTSAKGFYARYVHIHTVTVSLGQNVKQGDSIGKSGGDPSVAGSCSTGAHLHVEVYNAQGVLHDVYPCVYNQH